MVKISKSTNTHKHTLFSKSLFYEAIPTPNELNIYTLVIILYITLWHNIIIYTFAEKKNRILRYL